MEKKPYVILNSAAVWTCLDCGAKNYTELTPIDSPELRAQAGAAEHAELNQIPSTVKCISCEKDWSTTPVEETQELTTIDVLEDLVGAIDVIGHASKRKKKRAYQFLQNHHDILMEALHDALQGLTILRNQAQQSSEEEN